MPYWNEHGQQISLPEWATKKERSDNHPIAQSWVDGRAVRTYWRGVDLACCGNSPVIFETTLQNRNGHQEVIAQHSMNRSDAEAEHMRLYRELAEP